MRMPPVFCAAGFRTAAASLCGQAAQWKISSSGSAASGLGYGRQQATYPRPGQPARALLDPDETGRPRLHSGDRDGLTLRNVVRARAR